MVERFEKVTRVEGTAAPAETEPVASSQPVREVREVREAKVGGSIMAARIIWYIFGILLVLLAFRFVLTLLGANPNNSFANFIYSLSHPFVAPFFSLFSYNIHYGVSRFETFTLVAMAVYAIIAYGLARLVTINHVHQTTTA